VATGYRVIFLGMQAGKDIRTVKQGLADAFRSTPEKMELLLAKLPIVLKEDVDHATARRYQKVVLEAGGDCRVEPLEATDPSHSTGVPSEPASPLKVCPKCGYQAVSPDGRTAGLEEMNADSTAKLESTIRILPGESKVFTISCYLTLLHEEISNPLEMEPLLRVDTNTWEEMGVEVELKGRIITQSVDLWERSTDGSNWRPVRAEQSIEFSSADFMMSNAKALHCNNFRRSEKLPGCRGRKLIKPLINMKGARLN